MYRRLSSSAYQRIHKQLQSKNPSKATERAIRPVYFRAREFVLKCNEEYYGAGQTSISDIEYDAIQKWLEQVENQYPHLSVNSPTQAVDHAKPLRRLIAHSPPMLSLQNSYTQEDVAAFCRRCSAALASSNDPSFVLEPKVDGIAISVTFRNGRFEQAVTRGDGKSGEDVTANFRTLEAAQVILRGPTTDVIEVRGEVFVSKKDFLAFSQKPKAKRPQNEPQPNVDRKEDGGGMAATKRKTKKGQRRGGVGFVDSDAHPAGGDAHQVFSSPRSLAAGSIRCGDPCETASRPLSCVFYSIVEGFPEGEPYTQRNVHKILNDWGLPSLLEHIVILPTPDADQCWEALCDYRPRGSTLPYECDGVVVKMDDLICAAEMGSSAKYPKAQMAFKYPPEGSPTVVRDIIAQVGRTGKVTPVAIVDPVVIDNTEIARVSLSSAKVIEDKGIWIGAPVEVVKAGHVIPQITRVLPSNDAQGVWTMPSSCPCCGGRIVAEGGQHFCRNSRACPVQLTGMLELAVGKAGFRIDGLGARLIEQIVARGTTKVSDLFKLRVEDLVPLERCGKRSAQKIVASLQRHTAEPPPLATTLTAMGLVGVGETVASQLADRYETIPALLNATSTELEEICGPAKAATIIAQFKDPVVLEELQTMHSILYSQSVGKSIASVGKSIASPKRTKKKS
eukprot:Rmarinus@m.25631